jgi:hypothetical protein
MRRCSCHYGTLKLFECYLTSRVLQTGIRQYLGVLYGVYESYRGLLQSEIVAVSPSSTKKAFLETGIVKYLRAVKGSRQSGHIRRIKALSIRMGELPDSQSPFSYIRSGFNNELYRKSSNCWRKLYFRYSVYSTELIHSLGWRSRWRCICTRAPQVWKAHGHGHYSQREQEYST